MKPDSKRGESQRRRAAGAKGNAAFRLAERVIALADPTAHADDVLRAELKAGRLSQDEAGEASRAVFSYFRWLGWIGRNSSLAQKLRSALELADRFASAPETISESDLRARAVPGWILSEMEVSVAWLRALQTEPRVWLRAKSGTGPALAERLGHCRVFGEGPLADTLDYAGKEDLFLRPQFRNGQFELQDLSSQVVSLVCRPEAGQLWWDACAGEGGKALHLSELMRNTGLIWATDRAEWRLRKLRRRAARAKVFNYRTALWDGAGQCPTRTRFDGVLVDAPCSGVGTWHRNPHARWTTKPSDVRELAEVQLKMLTRVAPSIKPDGKLVYSVCTLLRSETEEVAKRFQTTAPDFEPLEIANPLGSRGFLTGQLTLWPQEFGGNGMFIAAWRRRR